MKKIFAVAVCTVMSVAFAGCGGASVVESTASTEVDDQMWSEPVSGAELEVFVRDGKVYTAENEYELSGIIGVDELEEGKKYLLKADVTILNGGVAGYVDYPQIDRFISIEVIKDMDAAQEAKEERLLLSIDGEELAVDWEDNESVKALKEMVKDKPLEIAMSMYGGFEQVGELGAKLPSNDVQTTTAPGDIVLYSGDKVVVFYGTNSWEYTRLGKIADKTEAELSGILGQGDVRLTLDIR